MATPAPAIANSRPLHLVSLGELKAELSQLRTEIETARFRESELERQSARLQEVIAANQATRSRLKTRLQQQTIRPAHGVSAPTADSLRDKLKAEKDPKERFRLQQRIDALEQSRFLS
jgi:predicted  nucleic acid-binding Zn-ribbon protein